MLEEIPKFCFPGRLWRVVCRPWVHIFASDPLCSIQPDPPPSHWPVWKWVPFFSFFFFFPLLSDNLISVTFCPNPQLHPLSASSWSGSPGRPGASRWSRRCGEPQTPLLSSSARWSLCQFWSNTLSPPRSLHSECLPSRCLQDIGGVRGGGYLLLKPQLTYSECFPSTTSFCGILTSIREFSLHLNIFCTVCSLSFVSVKMAFFFYFSFKL